MRHKRDREEACHICGHYHDYEGGEPCSICGHVIVVAPTEKHDSVVPTTIIPGFLYIGNYDSASRSELLKAMNISYILNSVPSCQSLYRNTFIYHTVSASPPDFQECFKFLDSVLKHNSKVLVYCMSGVSRSPAIVIGYMMHHRRWRLLESFKWVKDRRPTININPGDTQRLLELELLLHGTNSLPPDIAKLDDAGYFGFGVAQDAQLARTSSPSMCNSGPVFCEPQVSWGLQSSSVTGAGGSAFVFGDVSEQQQGQQQGQQQEQQQQQDNSNDMET